MLTEASGIRQRAVDFYSQLYDLEYKEDELEGPLTEEEVYAALQSMQGGKAPGIDGLPPEFFKAFWSSLRVLMTRFCHRVVGEQC